MNAKSEMGAKGITVVLDVDVKWNLSVKGITLPNLGDWMDAQSIQEGGQFKGGISQIIAFVQN